MISIAKIMIYGTTGLHAEGSYERKRLDARKDIFDRLAEFSPKERCSIVDNLIGVLKFDCPEYQTLEDECIEEYESDIRNLIADIERLPGDAVKSEWVVNTLKEMLPDNED